MYLQGRWQRKFSLCMFALQALKSYLLERALWAWKMLGHYHNECVLDFHVQAWANMATNACVCVCVCGGGSACVPMRFFCLRCLDGLENALRESWGWTWKKIRSQTLSKLHQARCNRGIVAFWFRKTQKYPRHWCMSVAGLACDPGTGCKKKLLACHR